MAARLLCESAGVEIGMTLPVMEPDLWAEPGTLDVPATVPQPTSTKTSPDQNPTLMSVDREETRVSGRMAVAAGNISPSRK